MVNWAVFQSLPGGVEHNFESLCRSLVLLHYGRHGRLAALANQPGVEFHLQLQTDCSLGSAGQWFGWQCRWYDLPRGSSLTQARRAKIEDALRKTEKALPDLTDWVLWTRYPLTKSDQAWFYALTTSMHLALWTAANAETLLSGDAEILRRTYFGELVLTPTTLLQQHDLSTARIKKRWLPEAHQVVDAEHVLRRMLGEAASWEELSVIAKRMVAVVAVVTAEPRAFLGRFSSSTPEFIKVTQTFAELLETVYQLLRNGDFELLRQVLDQRKQKVSRETEDVPRRLRNARIACGLDATNALADMRLGVRLLDEVNDSLGTGLVSVLADAGGGKTQLSAQLTAPTTDRPGGILLFGRELHSGRTLDDLVKHIVIQGNPVPTMEALLAALDAAGQRAKRRLPLVIDGLNEAEDPREWQGPLAALDTLLKRFAYILAVCTVRTGARRPAESDWRRARIEEPSARWDFARQALPEGVRQIEIPGFAGDTMAAVRKYFAYFRIVPGDAEISLELFTHPLTLRIYCEVTNPERKRDVVIEALPGSLTGLFEQYIDNAIKRVAELAPRHHRYLEQDIRHALDIIGTQFWKENARELPKDELRRAIGDESRPWNESILHMLEQEGVILRIPGKVPGREDIIPVYDAIGGYLVATAILTNLGRANFKTWLGGAETLEALNGNTSNCHPLALDIFGALVALVPRRLHRQQVWQLVDEPLRSVALKMAAALEGKYLDVATVDAIANFVRDARPGSSDLFLRFFRTRAIPEHPLNANFFDSLLRSMTAGQRDLQWTEWVRENGDGIQKNAQNLEESWQGQFVARAASDRLRAKWLMWLLTTTVLNLRDRVTRALYWFGRGEPVTLFEQTEQACDIDDPSVFERALAASYGVAMAAHCDSTQSTFRNTILPEHARRIFDLLFRRNAPGRTTHVLTREYGRRFVELAVLHNSQLFTSRELSRVRPPYVNGSRIPWQKVKAGKVITAAAASPLHMDFANYTLGRLVEGRANYDFKHAGYRRVRAQVLWRVEQLGWTADRFQHIDHSIESSHDRYGPRSDDHYKVDRYGKKYSRIAFLELQGWLQDRGLLSKRNDSGRTWDVDIDPSFPSPTREHRLVTTDFLGDPSTSLRAWIETGPVPNLAPYLRQASLLDENGPWIALDAFVTQQDESRGRRMFAFLRSFLVNEREEQAFARCLGKQPLGGRWLPEKLGVLYAFAGEIPWCETFPETPWSEMSFVVKAKTVKVRRKRAFFYLDDKVTDLTEMDIVRLRMFGFETDLKNSSLTKADLSRLTRREHIVEVDEVQQDVKEFRTIMPVWDSGWEGRTIEEASSRGEVLAKRLAKAAKLVHLPQTHDLQTKQGVRATYGIACNAKDFNNSQQLFYIREDILRSLLQRLHLRLVWAIWGERELSYKQMNRARPDGDLAGLHHVDFQTIHRFN